MKIAEIRDNKGKIVKVIAGLKVGDKLYCKNTQRSTSGLGLWSSELYDSFEKGKTYKVSSVSNWNGTMVARVIDEDGCSCWPTPETFSLVETSVKKFVYSSKQLRENYCPTNKKLRRIEWISYWYSDQIASASW